MFRKDDRNLFKSLLLKKPVFIGVKRDLINLFQLKKNRRMRVRILSRTLYNPLKTQGFQGIFLLSHTKIATTFLVLNDTYNVAFLYSGAFTISSMESAEIHFVK